MGVTVDTTYVVDLLRADAGAVRKAEALDDAGEAAYLSTPVMYEVVAGLLSTRSRTEAAAFRALAGRFATLAFDAAAAQRAAELRAELRRLGRPKGHVDVMIAGIALVGGHRLVTRDQDFAEIAGVFDLAVDSY